MLIYNGNSSFRATSGGYKSTSNRKRKSNRAKVAKRKTTRRGKKSKKKNLKAKNIKFLKSLGFKVKKR